MGLWQKIFGGAEPWRFEPETHISNQAPYTMPKEHIESIRTVEDLVQSRLKKVRFSIDPDNIFVVAPHNEVYVAKGAWIDRNDEYYDDLHIVFDIGDDAHHDDQLYLYVPRRFKFSPIEVEQSTLNFMGVYPITWVITKSVVEYV